MTCSTRTRSLANAWWLLLLHLWQWLLAGLFGGSTSSRMTREQNPDNLGQPSHNWEDTKGKRVRLNILKSWVLPVSTAVQIICRVSNSTNSCAFRVWHYSNGTSKKSKIQLVRMIIIWGLRERGCRCQPLSLTNLIWLLDGCEREQLPCPWEAQILHPKKLREELMVEVIV